MKRLVAIVFLAVVPVLSRAQDISVRSGEHGDFTRLVFDLPRALNWELDQEADSDSILLSLDQRGITFDTARVFDRITRDRVASVEPVSNRSEIAIELACNCEAEVFLAGTRMLVVDIREKAQQEAVRPAPTPLPDFTQLRIGPQPGIGPDSQTKPRIPNWELANRLLPDPIQPEPSDEAMALAGAVLRDIAGAASMGLLSPSGIKRAGVDAPAAPVPDTLVEPEQKNGFEKDISVALSGLGKDSSGKNAVSIGGRRCLPNDRVDIADWSQHEDVSIALAEGRGRLYEEFDRPSNKAIREMAKTLLYFGLGAETRAVLSLSDDVSEPVLMAMSYIVDGELDPGSVFEGQMTCDGAVALWAALSTRAPNRLRDANHAAISRAFEMLPRHLRLQIGDMLVRAFTAAGDTSMASDILRRMERSFPEPSVEVSVGKAHLAAANGDLDGAQSAFERLATTAGPQAPEALAAAIEIAHDNSEQVSEQLVGLSEAFAAEHRGSDDGSELWLAHLRAQLTNGQIIEAVEQLETATDQSEQILVKAIADVAQSAVFDSSDIVFLKLALAGRIPKPTPFRPELDRAIAARLLDMGFAEAALQKLSETPVALRDDQAVYLQGNALLELSRPEEAEILMIGRQSDEAMRIRARARSAMGDHAFARQLYADLGDSEEAENMAKLSGEWAALDGENATPFLDAADIVTTVDDDLTRGAVNLQQVDALAQDSVSARSALEALLNATELTQLD